MSELRVRNVSKLYGDFHALNDVSIEVEEGAFIVLLGPSGCGKSTLLHAISGLHEISEGRILIDGEDVTNLPARQRDVAMVFQSYALYPTKTVRDNIAFPLRMRGYKKQEAIKRAAEVAETLHIQSLLDRFPRDLSGGQRQRVAIGRALVRDPRLFLFDEPLSNLDAGLRSALRSEIKRLHQLIQRTMVYVTHDQIEAMTLATKIVIMNEGSVQQIGTPQEIYHNPRNLFVAKFIGTPPIGLTSGEISSSPDLRFVHQLGSIPLDSRFAGIRPGKVLLAVRPESTELVATGGHLPATVDLVEPTGPEDIVTVKIGDDLIVLRTSAGKFSTGSAVGVQYQMGEAMFFDPGTGERL